jgi:multicomponent Na+:H+ antiporter subunit F
MPQVYLTATAVAILIVMALALIRAVLGPSVYDRALAVNMFGTKTVLLISVIDFLGGRQEFLDIAFAYALINFISVIAMLKFYRYADLYRADETPASHEETTPT